MQMQMRDARCVMREVYGRVCRGGKEIPSCAYYDTLTTTRSLHLAEFHQEFQKPPNMSLPCCNSWDELTVAAHGQTLAPTDGRLSGGAHVSTHKMRRRVVTAPRARSGRSACPACPHNRSMPFQPFHLSGLSDAVRHTRCGQGRIAVDPPDFPTSECRLSPPAAPWTRIRMIPVGWAHLLARSACSQLVLLLLLWPTPLSRIAPELCRR